MCIFSGTADLPSWPEDKPQGNLVATSGDSESQNKSVTIVRDSFFFCSCLLISYHAQPQAPSLVVCWLAELFA